MEVNKMVSATLDKEINLGNFQTESPESISYDYPLLSLSFHLLSGPQGSI